jgi:hypothetical protein
VCLLSMMRGGLINTGLELGGYGLALSLRLVPCGEKGKKHAVNQDIGFAIHCKPMRYPVSKSSTLFPLRLPTEPRRVLDSSTEQIDSETDDHIPERKKSIK